MNFTNESWFTNLPANTQQDIIYQYQNGSLTDNDISKLKNVYSPQPKSKVKPMNTIAKVGFGPLIAGGTAASNGSGFLDTMKAMGRSSGNEFKSAGSDILNTIFDPFFNCFKSKFFAEDSYGPIFVAYAIGINSVLNNDTNIDLNNPNVIKNIPLVVNSVFNQYLPKMAEIIWTDGLKTGFFSTIADTIRDGMFYTTDKLLKMLNAQTFNILLPAMKSMGNIFTYDYIKKSLNRTGINQFGITKNGDIINIDISKFRNSTPTLKNLLKDGIIEIRGECINNMKTGFLNKFNEALKSFKESSVPPLKTNPALDTLNKQKSQSTPSSSSTNNQTKRTLTPISQNMTPEQQKQYDAAQADIGTGLGGLGTTGEGEKYRFDQLMNQAGQQFGLNSDQLSKMGFGPQEDNESPAVKMGIPKEQQDEFDKWIQQKMKDEWYKKYPQSQPSDAWNSLFQ